MIMKIVKEEILEFIEYIGVAVSCVIGISIGAWLYFWEYYVIKEQGNYDHISVPE